MALATNLKNASCEFCGYKGPVLEQCRKYNVAKVEARKPKRVQPPNTTPNSTLSPQSETAVPVTTTIEGEFSGNTGHNSLCSVLSSPNTYLWNADTGTMAHMTPHHFWL